MSEPLPSQPAPTPPPAASPAFDPKEIIDAAVGVVTRPAAFFEGQRAKEGLVPPIVFAAVMGVVAGLLGTVLAIVGLHPASAFGGALGVGLAIASIVYLPILYLVFGCGLGGAITHVIALIAGGKGKFEQSVRIAAYCTAFAPIAVLAGALPFVGPFIGVAVNLYALYALALGVIAVHLADRKKTFIVAGVLAALLVIFMLIGLLTAAAARRAGAQLESQFGQGSEFQQKMAEMQKAAEQMQRAAEAQQRAQGGEGQAAEQGQQ